MREYTFVRAAIAALLLGTVAHAAPLKAQDDEPERGWFYNAELTLVFTSGNARANTFGLGAGLRRVWESTTLALRVGSLRTETANITRTAVGTPDAFTVEEDSELRLTAENYFARLRLDRSLSDRVFVFGSTGWERNTFAGYDNRFSFVAGLGNTWIDSDRTRFKTDYGFTFTTQDDVIDDPDTSDSFAGLRGSFEFWRQLTSTTSFESALAVDESLKDTEDLRADFTNSILIDISGALALKTSLALRYDNLPSLTSVALEQPLGTPTGETVLVPLDELDTLFTIALVASF